MSRERYRITGEIEVLSPLHVGTSLFRPIAIVTGKKGSNDAPLVAAIVRDFEDKPFIPGTALKGLMLRLAERLDEPSRVALFGVAKNDESGKMGTAIFRGLAWKKPGATQNLPYAAGCATAVDKDGLGPGVFVSARTAIDRHSGTAEDNKLFFQEMVAPGARFALDILVEGADQAANVEGLLRLLAELAAVSGHGIGKNEADGFGRIRLTGDLAIMHEKLDGQGDFVNGGQAAALAQKWKTIYNKSQKQQPSGKQPWLKALLLTCKDPFLVVDSSYAGSGKEVPQIVGQKDAGSLPLLLGSSLTGAMRARARWMKALTARDPKAVDRTDHVVRDPKDAEGLTPVERLFGVTGFRGLLQVDALKVLTAVPMEIASVKLDRFTGGPFDNALFKTQAHRDVTVRVVLRLASREGVGKAEADDMDFATKLVGDMCKRGLVLGHGGSKGFGWFDVKEAP